MAEIKNNFVQSKMNKDLDARLVPNGQYRDAQNIVISKSDGDDVGTVQNILGNIELTNFGLNDKHLQIIGYFVDELKNNVYVFITNYTDSSLDNLSNFAPTASKHYICSYNVVTGSANILVQGSFLNFSTISPINGVDMIEQSLFFTDNRNQPRKINVDTALSNPTYYTNEDQISIIKYYPFQAISLKKRAAVTLTPLTGQDAGRNWNYTLPYSVPSSLITVLGGTEGYGIELSVTGVGPAPDYSVTSVSLDNGGIGWADDSVLEILNPNGNVNDSFVVTMTTELMSTMKNVVDEYLPPRPTGNANSNPDYDPNWPGDKDFLQDKFIKFSYRFKFEDNEYSLLAPFTQTCFVPNQWGYFLTEPATQIDGTVDLDAIPDEEYSYTSTTNRLMFNQINNVQLIIPCPPDSNTWSQAVEDFKISEVEIIYKDAEKTSLQVVDTIPAQALRQVGFNLATYDYQSRKPIKTLPDNVLTRTSDKAPIRAESLSCVGNRVVFSNYFDKHTSPETLDYNTNISDKSEEESIEYPNHTLKQNRTYQVGVILSDRYGRQSDVILSEIDNGVVPGLIDSFSGSTVFNSYRGLNDTPLNTSTDSWNGEKLQIIWRKAIPNVINSPGYPGLYSPTNPLGYYSFRYVVKQQEQDYYNVYLPSILRGYPNDPNKEATTTAHISLFSDNVNKVPKDLTDVGPETKEFRSGIRLFGRVSNVRSIGSGNAQFYPTTTGDFVNTIGTQDDLNIGSSEKVSQRVSVQPANFPANELFLAAPVGGTPKVTLGGRVSILDNTGTILQDNAQIIGYQLGGNSNVGGTPSAFATALRISPGVPSPGSNTVDSVVFQLSPFYNAINNPLIARISTFRSQTNTGYSNLIGETVDFSPALYFPIELAVYETAPVVSNLDIFYETSQSGIISDLNTLITSGQGTTPYSYSDPQFTWFENAPTGSVLTTTIFPLNSAGQIISDPLTAFSLTSTEAVVNGVVTTLSSNIFELQLQPGSGGFLIKTKNTQNAEDFFYGVNDVNNNREFRFNISAVGPAFSNFNGTVVGRISNIAPSAVDFRTGDSPGGGSQGAPFQHGTATNIGPINSPSQGYVYVGSLINQGQLDTPTSYTPKSSSSKISKITNGTRFNGFVNIPINTSQLFVKDLYAVAVGGNYLPGWVQPGDIVGDVQGTVNPFAIRSCQARISNGTVNGALDTNDNSSTGLGIEFTGDNLAQYTSQPNPPQFLRSTWDIYFTLVDAAGQGAEVNFGPLRLIFTAPTP